MRVTAAVLASCRPSTVSPLFTVIDAEARMLPTKLETESGVAELPTCQKTLRADAPPAKVMSALCREPTVSVEPIWKLRTASDRLRQSGSRQYRETGRDLRR